MSFSVSHGQRHISRGCHFLTWDDPAMFHKSHHMRIISASFYTRRNYQCDLFASDIWSLWCASCLHTASPFCAPPGLSADVVNMLLSLSSLVYTTYTNGCNWTAEGNHQPCSWLHNMEQNLKVSFHLIIHTVIYAFVNKAFVATWGRSLTQYSHLSGWYDEPIGTLPRRYRSTLTCV